MYLEKPKVEYGNSVKDFSLELYNFIKYYSTRREAFNLDIIKHIFEGHVPTWWLSLGSVVERILEQWAVTVKFMKDLSVHPAT